ncbi:MAG: biotin transporter BioY [Blautia sp.]|nr:biotin transporter BioY [Blautia sp.]
MKHALSTRDLVHIALGAVLTAICSWISIPTVVPFTMQTFAVFCVLHTLGGKKGTLSIILYILLGAIGVPVFSGFSGGPGVLLGSTGGYIIGFIFMGLLYWMAETLFGAKLYTAIVSMVGGLILCYAFGTAWFMVVYAGKSGPVGLTTVLSWCVLPFIVPDLIKLALAVTVASRVKTAAKALA